MPCSDQTVLIIDDDESVRRALRRLVRSVGLKAESHATAEEFLRAPEKPAPGCLVLDVHLPGLSGLELQQYLATKGRRIPIVFITAYVEENIRERALRAGAVAFLYKPFEEQALLDAIAIALRGPLSDVECN
jgi:FixJ family two-component response regulator